MRQLKPSQRTALLRLLTALIDQQRAAVMVPAYEPRPGFWFGGGNLARDAAGTMWLSGRYRNFGDSRTGLAAGSRGLECAIFRSGEGREVEKVASFSKSELSYPDRGVLSIEGTALHQQPDQTWELFISSEKEADYPEHLKPYQKPGTGIWSIDVISGPSPDAFDTRTLRPVLESLIRPESLHVKDPVVFDLPDHNTAMIFCSHPFSWTSSNSGLALRTQGSESFSVRDWQMVQRGTTWDVAVTRVTGRLQVPRLGAFAHEPAMSLYFYDGAECVRQLDENVHALHRPRGYSCEEIGGALAGWDEDFPALQRLSRLEPLFLSPHGTGCSRYVDVLNTGDSLVATWQQSQQDGSQPLVSHALPMVIVEELMQDTEL